MSRRVWQLPTKSQREAVEHKPADVARASGASEGFLRSIPARLPRVGIATSSCSLLCDTKAAGLAADSPRRFAAHSTVLCSLDHKYVPDNYYTCKIKTKA